MATPKKGWRRIIVDGKQFHWTIRHKPDYFNNISQKGMWFTVESVNGALLVVNLIRPRLDYWPEMTINLDIRPVTPSEVTTWIKRAISLDWNPEVKTKPLVLSE